jgi:ABC-type dipeptide/oligopeptide/nickel transport system permease subunit
LTRVGGADFIAWGGRIREARKVQTFDALCVFFFPLFLFVFCLLVSYFLLAREL